MKETVPVLSRWKRNTLRNPALERLMAKCTRANRSARQIGIPGRIRVRDVRYLPRLCVYCGSTENLTVDHVTPLRRGGENHWSNLTTACFSCNRKKGNRMPTEFLATRGQCTRGHELTDENSRLSEGRRRCRICAKAARGRTRAS